MSQNPFTADSSARERIAAAEARCGAAVRARIEAVAGRGPQALAANAGGVVPAAEVAALVTAFGLGGVEDVMVLARDSAAKIARPPISQFFVGAVGLERETGNLVLGGNVEFPGTHLGMTIHGEGCVFSRSFSRGTTIGMLALGEAHPCGHCRQFLSEFAAARDLVLIDALGHRLRMADLYPWPFDPAYLGEAGLVPGTLRQPGLALAENDIAPAVAERLLAAGKRAYAPYSRCPGAAVLTLKDGNIVAGASIESVAFNPTIGPLQAALIDVIVHGYGYDDIAAAAVATTAGGAVDYGASTRELLGRVAPGVPLAVVEWRE